MRDEPRGTMIMHKDGTYTITLQKVKLSSEMMVTVNDDGTFTLELGRIILHQGGSS